MTTDYFSINGFDIWHRTEATAHQLKNLHTGETLVFKEIPKKFQPVIMPEGAIEQQAKKKTKVTNPRKTKTKAKRPQCLQKYKRASKKKSKYKGVKKNENGKFTAWYWDKKKQRSIFLGSTFDNEIYAAAQVMKALGRTEEYNKLIVEYNGTLGPEQFPPEDKTVQISVTGGNQTGDIDQPIV